MLAVGLGGSLGLKMLKPHALQSRKIDAPLSCRSLVIRDRSSSMADRRARVSRLPHFARLTTSLLVILASGLVSKIGLAQSPEEVRPAQQDVPEPASIYPILGFRWFEFMNDDLRDVYSGGPGFAAGFGLRLGNRISAEAELEWFRGQANPTTPPFVERSSSTLTLLPISAMLRYQVAARTDGLFLLVGPALIRQTESFSYSLLDERDTVSGALTGVGLSIGVGWEATRRPLAYRIVARAILGNVKRSILRDGAPAIETEETIAPSMAGVGLEIRLP
jgi:hypothetical protein